MADVVDPLRSPPVNELYVDMGDGTHAKRISATVTSSPADAARIGATNEGAAANPAATSGLNGVIKGMWTSLLVLITLFPASLGAKTAAASLSVTQASDISFGPTVSFTRPNDTAVYAAGDVVGAATGSTAALQFTVASGAGEWMITSASLEIDAAAIISGETNYRLELYNVTPPSALGDNAAWDLPSGDRTAYLGFIDLGTPVDKGSTLYCEANAINKQITTLGANIFGYLVTVGTYTPTALRVKAIKLHTVKM